MFRSQLPQEQKARVLHVDDELDVIQVTEEILEVGGGLEVHGASSVAEAFEMLSQEEYDVIVSDYQMPDKDGLQFLRELREKGDNRPFVVFTGKGEDWVAVEALSLGAFGYINKNGNPETVYAELASAIQRATLDWRFEKQSSRRVRAKRERIR